MDEEILYIPKRISKVSKRFPHKVPVYIHSKCVDITKTKYLLSKELPFHAFIKKVREDIYMKPWEGLYFMVHNNLVPASLSVGEILESLGKESGYLDVHVVKENVFG